MHPLRTAARAFGIVLVGAAFFWNVRPLSTPASDPTITQAVVTGVEDAAAAVVAAAEPIPVPIGPIPQNVPTGQPSPMPAPTQGAPYNPAKNVPPPSHGGPITIAVNGNLLVSRRLEFGGTDTSAGAPQGDESIGATIEVARRTTQTATRVTFPSNLSANSQASLGGATAEYDTTTLSYLYGPQQISALNLVPLGSTLRGFALVSPLKKGGDLTLFSGPGQSGFPTFALNGIRLREPVKNGFFGLTALDAKVENAPGRTDALSLGLANRVGLLQTGSELVVERNNGFVADPTSGAAIVPNGIAYAFQSRIDATAGLNASSLTVRDQSPEFVNVGSSGSSASDVYGDLSLRHSSIRGSSVQLDLSDERYVAGQVTVSTHESIGYTTRLGQTGSAQFNVTNGTGLNGDSRIWTGGTQFSYGATFKTLAVQANFSATRQTEDGLDPTGAYGFGLGFSKVLSPTSAANLFYTYQQQSSATTGIGSNGSLTLGLSRQFHKTNVLGQLVYSRSSEVGSDERSLTPSVTISRRISPALTFNVGAFGDFHKDLLDPTAHAHTIAITTSIGAPIAFGNGVVNGRVNPKLPAEIDGFVAQDSFQNGVQSTTGFGLSGGIGNILIVLDGTRSVRTDSRGQFQFSFITPGRHDVVIDPGSLPIGLTADQPSTTLNLSGGQTAHLALGIGTYGLIEGHVYGRDSGGAEIPVPGATLLLDDGTRQLTNAAGYYGFGRLLPGKHTVHVDLATIPASLALPADSAKSVSVIPGQRISVDFIGAPLGSIAGSLVYDGSAVPAEDGKPVLDAYVVANPGDHAAIVDNFGRFIIDNLPAGTYEISVDEDTLAEDHGVVSQSPLEAVLISGGSVTGLHFTIGSKPRNVVFSFKQGDTNVLDVKVPLNPQPAGVGVPIVVTASEPADAVSVTGLGGPPVALAPSGDKKTWRGTLHVSTLARSGVVPLTVKATGAHPGDGSAKLTIDQNLQVAFFALNPARPVTNQFVHVKARFFTDVRKGDKIIWSDGATTVLGAPVHGIVEFDVKMASVPYVGTLLSGGEQYRLVLRSR